jgi:hypothetical protein
LAELELQLGLEFLQLALLVVLEQRWPPFQPSMENKASQVSHIPIFIHHSTKEDRKMYSQ